MVEHLKVPPHSLYTLLLKIFHQMHHPSCHGDSEKGVVQQILLLLQQARSRGRGKSRSPTKEEAKKMLDLNMNTKSAGKIFVCPEPRCLFKTEYQSNMV